MTAPPTSESPASAALHMDVIYRRQRHIYDATRKYYLLGRDRLLAELAPPDGGSVLEIACGTGRNLVLAARRYPRAHYFGFDISTAMLETARGSIARAGPSQRIAIAHGDAARFTGTELFGVPNFDRVFISYALSMIPPWREAILEAWRAVAPGGALHIVDFGTEARLPAWFRSGLKRWLAKFSVEPRADLERALRALAEKEGARLVLERPYRGYALLAVLTKPR